MTEKPFEVGDMVIRMAHGYAIGYAECVSDMLQLENGIDWLFRTREDSVYRSSAEWQKMKPLSLQPHD